MQYQITKTQLFLQDKNIDLDDLTELEDDTIFNVERIWTGTYEKEYDVQMEISFQMNLDKHQVARTGYTILDVLSDVGGIQGLLISFCTIALGVINYNNFDNQLASRLFKIKGQPGKLDDPKTISSFIYPTKWLNLFEYFLDVVPERIKCKCKFCNKSRSLRAVEKARERMEQEINIVHIVKSRRYFQRALRLLLSRRTREQMQKQSRYIYINPDDSSENEKDDDPFDINISMRRFGPKDDGSSYEAESSIEDDKEKDKTQNVKKWLDS